MAEEGHLRRLVRQNVEHRHRRDAEVPARVPDERHELQVLLPMEGPIGALLLARPFLDPPWAWIDREVVILLGKEGSTAPNFVVLVFAQIRRSSSLAWVSNLSRFQVAADTPAQILGGPGGDNPK
eukprot:2581152-Rhodomonas_salina.1